MPLRVPNKVMKLRPNTRVRAKASEKPSVEALFEAEESPLLRYAYGMVARREVAEEIVQDAFLKLHQHWKDIDNPRAWLYRATRNLSLNHLRKYRRESLTEDSDLEPTAQDLPDVELGRMEAIGTLRTLIEELPPADRQLIQLKYHDELSYGNIGEELELSTGNVGYKLHHLLKHLSEALQKAGISSPRG